MIFARHTKNGSLWLPFFLLAFGCFTLKSQTNSFEGVVKYTVNILPPFGEDHLPEFGPHNLYGKQRIIRIAGDSLKSIRIGGELEKIINIYLSRQEYSINHRVLKVNKNIYKDNLTSYDRHRKTAHSRLVHMGVSDTLMSLPVMQYNTLDNQRSFWYYDVPVLTEIGMGLVNMDYGIALKAIIHTSMYSVEFLATSIEWKDISPEEFALPGDYPIVEFYPPSVK